jgi:hypothetical protein
MAFLNECIPAVLFRGQVERPAELFTLTCSTWGTSMLRYCQPTYAELVRTSNRFFVKFTSTPVQEGWYPYTKPNIPNLKHLQGGLTRRLKGAANVFG